MKRLFQLVALAVLLVGGVAGCGGGGSNGVVVDTVSPFIGTYLGNFRTAAGGQDLKVIITPHAGIRFRDNTPAPLTDNFDIEGSFNPTTNAIAGTGIVFYGGDFGQQTQFTGTMEINNGVISGSGTWTIIPTGASGTWSVSKTSSESPLN